MEFRNLMEKSKLGGEDDLRCTVDYVLVDSPYNARRDQKHGHAEYGVFCWSYMKYMAMVLGDMKPGALEHVCCSAL